MIHQNRGQISPRQQILQREPAATPETALQILVI